MQDVNTVIWAGIAISGQFNVANMTKKVAQAEGHSSLRANFHRKAGGAERQSNVEAKNQGAEAFAYAEHHVSGVL